MLNSKTYLINITSYIIIIIIIINVKNEISFFHKMLCR
jgi:hypothetical protein